MSFELTYLGHSCFKIKKDDEIILIDPFLEQNSSYNYENDKITHIFLTHAHSDHLGSAVEISKSQKSQITALFELANYCSKKGANTFAVNIGAWLNYSWGKALFLPAFHSSSTPDGAYGGMPSSILFEIDGKFFYHAGDNCLNSEMKLLGENYELDMALLPIGGIFTMDINEALKAAKLLKAKTIIPMHYNTFEPIMVNIGEFEKLSKLQNQNSKIMQINETITI